MPATRTVQPEILDSLPADDPSARRSRSDLRLINALMGNFRWVERQLSHNSEAKQVIELGAGEGCLVRRLARRGYRVTAVDLAPPPDDLPESVHWVQDDLWRFEEFNDTTVIATLFLHHFTTAELKRLGERLASARTLIFSEPRRSRVALCGGYLLFPLVNHVTRHDMMVSIRAGFRLGELPAALGLDARWEVREETSLLGACRMVARKR